MLGETIMTDATVKKEQAQSSLILRRITVTAVFAAMITLMTAYIFHIPTGMNEGYIHFGDALIYVAAAILPLPYACAAGAIGGGWRIFSQHRYGRRQLLSLK